MYMGKRAVVYGDPDVVCWRLQDFAAKEEFVWCLCANAPAAPDMEERLRVMSPASEDPAISAHDTDFDRIAEMA